MKIMQPGPDGEPREFQMGPDGKLRPVTVAHQISIYCAGPETSEHKRQGIALFAGGTPNSSWSPVDGVGPWAPVGRKSAVRSWMLDGRVIPVERFQEELFDTGRDASQHWTFLCRRCRARLTIRRDTLLPILDSVVDDGVSEITLRDLNAKVRARQEP